MTHTIFCRMGIDLHGGQPNPHPKQDPRNDFLYQDQSLVPLRTTTKPVVCVDEQMCKQLEVIGRIDTD